MHVYVWSGFRRHLDSIFVWMNSSIQVCSMRNLKSRNVLSARDSQPHVVALQSYKSCQLEQSGRKTRKESKKSFSMFFLIHKISSLYFLASLHESTKRRKWKEFYNRIQNATSINIVCVFLCHCDEDNGMNVNWRVRWKLVYIKNLFLVFLLLSFHIQPVSHCPCFGNWIQPKVTHIIHSMRWIKTSAPWETSPSSCLHLRWLTTHCKFAVLCNNSISATRWSSPRFDMRPNSRDCALSAHCRC